MVELLQQILASIDFGQILTAIFVAVLIPILRRVGRLINTKVTDVDNSLITYAVATAVRFVEQKYKDLESIEKYRIARDRALSWLNKRGIKLDEEDIQTAIEAAVKALTGEIDLTKN